MFKSLFRRRTLHSSVMVPGRPIDSPSRTGLAIVAIIKDEAPYIGDWIKFHALAGVKDFFIYDDGSTDGSAEVAQSISGVKLTIIPWRLSVSVVKPAVVLSRQVLAYCHAIENFGASFRWMAFIDIDEFLVPKSALTIMDVLDELEQFSNISLPWRMFGPDGNRTMPIIPAPYAFKKCSEMRTGPLLNFKCIIDPLQVTEVRVHRFQTYTMGKNSSNDAGVIAHYKRRYLSEFCLATKLQLNHYYTRSLSELESKLSKGAVSGSPPDRRAKKVMEKLALIEQAPVDDRSAIAFLERHHISGPEHFAHVGFKDMK